MAEKFVYKKNSMALHLHSSLVTRMRGFETKLKFLHKNVFQEIDDNFHAKKIKAT